jgi:hypothetical protein
VTGDIPRNHAAASRKKTDHHRVVFFLFIGAILQVNLTGRWLTFMNQHHGKITRLFYRFRMDRRALERHPVFVGPSSLPAA